MCARLLFFDVKDLIKFDGCIVKKYSNLLFCYDSVSIFHSLHQHRYDARCYGDIGEERE